MANLGVARLIPATLLTNCSRQRSKILCHKLYQVSYAINLYNHRSLGNAQKDRLLCAGNKRKPHDQNEFERHGLQFRSFQTTARRSRDHHFDTLKFVQCLREEGFTEAQAVAMMKVLSDVIEERFVSIFTA